MKKILVLFTALIALNLTFSQNSYHYIVDSIPYQTFQEQDIVQFNFDDIHSGVISLPFDFNFFETENITEIVVGSNGTVNFDLSLADTGQPWQIPVGFSIPNLELPIPAILGPFHDIDNSVSVDGGVYTGITGVAPNRRFHVTFEDIAGFGSCNAFISTFQIVLHESSGIVDVVITNKPNCTTWNNGFAVLGIQSIINSQAFGIAAPGRNTGQWVAQEEAWRFTPTSFFNEFNVVVCDVDNDGSEIFDVDNYKSSLLELFNLDDSVNSVSIIDNNSQEVAGNVSIVSGSNQPQNSYTIDFNNGEQLFDLTLAILNCNDDGDTDGLSNADEDVNGNGNLNDDDTDGDGIPNYLDDDDDGDSVLTNIELVFGRNSNNSVNTLDTDADGIPNHLDFDDDGDGVLTLDEDYNGNGDPTDDDVNGNGIPDYLDSDLLNVDKLSLNTSLFAVYPMPASSSITVQFSENIGFEGDDVLTSIYDMHGQLVLKQASPVLQNKFTVDISSLNGGNYVLVLQKDGLTRAKAFVKK